MKIIAGMATMQGREKQAEQAIKSLTPQVSHIHVYNNAEQPLDLTDNGKFYALQFYAEPIYFFSCDDDFNYPPDYVEQTLNAIENYRCIVTYHGRKLVGTGKHYYLDHDAYDCLETLAKDKLIDVAGTGVTAFRTDYFNPDAIWQAQDLRMSDLVFSLEAAKQSKRIMLLKHQAGWLKDLAVDPTLAIHLNEWDKCKRQGELADEIFLIKYPPEDGANSAS